MGNSLYGLSQLGQFIRDQLADQFARPTYHPDVALRNRIFGRLGPPFQIDPSKILTAIGVEPDKVKAFLGIDPAAADVPSQFTANQVGPGYHDTGTASAGFHRGGRVPGRGNQDSTSPHVSAMPVSPFRLGTLGRQWSTQGQPPVSDLAKALKPPNARDDN